MASSSFSSSVNKNCVYCSSHSDVLRAGWPLRNGGCAMLCNKCASAYEEGSFCNNFHLNDSGWRSCITCNKDVHCGCIMSYHLYCEVDCGGVKCKQCMTNDVSLVPMSSNSVVIPLLEKTLTRSDVNLKMGRLVLPKTSAEGCLPTPSPGGSLIRFQDNSGNYWDFNYCFWPMYKSGMYVLKGFKGYLLHHQCKAGDKVSLYRIDPEGKFMIELIKANAKSGSN